MTLSVRSARNEDAGAIAAIHAHHVLHDMATCEVVPPTEAETVGKTRRVTGRRRSLLAASDRRAYVDACENRIYVAHDRRGDGIATAPVASGRD